MAPILIDQLDQNSIRLLNWEKYWNAHNDDDDDDDDNQLEILNWNLNCR